MKTTNQETKMKVSILPHVYAQIMHYVDKSDVEISGLGRVERASDGTMVVTKVYLPKQVNGPASTDIDQEDMGRLLYESREDSGHLNFWWHSHVNMGAFWSGTDMATIRQFGGNGYLLATVFNKRREYKTALYRAGDSFFPEVFLDNIDTTVSYTPTQAERDSWDANMAQMCSREVYTPAPRTVYGGGYLGLMGDDPLAFQDESYWEKRGNVASVWAKDEISLDLKSDIPLKDLRANFMLAVNSKADWTMLSESQRQIVEDCAALVYGYTTGPITARSFFEECMGDTAIYLENVRDLGKAIKAEIKLRKQKAKV